MLGINDHDLVFLLYTFKNTIFGSGSFPEGKRVLPHLLKLIFAQFPSTISTVIGIARLCLWTNIQSIISIHLHTHIVVQRGEGKEGGGGGAGICLRFVGHDVIFDPLSWISLENNLHWWKLIQMTMEYRGKKKK